MNLKHLSCSKRLIERLLRCAFRRIIQIFSLKSTLGKYGRFPIIFCESKDQRFCCYNAGRVDRAVHRRTPPSAASTGRSASPTACQSFQYYSEVGFSKCIFKVERYQGDFNNQKNILVRAVIDIAESDTAASERNIFAISKPYSEIRGPYRWFSFCEKSGKNALDTVFLNCPTFDVVVAVSSGAVLCLLGLSVFIYRHYKVF